MSTRDTPESGTLPGYYAFAREPSRMETPSDPDEKRFSDVIRSFNAAPGASYGRQDAVGTPDAVDHNRGTESPSCSVAYDLQQFFIDAQGDPLDASVDGILRDDWNQLQNTHYIVERQYAPGGNDDAGVYVWTVVRGASVETVSPTLDPSSENPILMELDYQPRKVRSYKIHQLSSAEPVTPTSTEATADSGIDVTIEDEGANQSVTVAMGDSTDTDEFDEITRVWLSDAPEGDVTLESDTSSIEIVEIKGGNAYSDDDQPVDGDQGIPVIGAGSRASAIGTSYEHFVGDRFERPSGSAVRPRVNSGSWEVSNDFGTESVHTSRAPVVDEGNRSVSVDADVAGPFVSHESMLESLTKVQHDLEHELSGGLVTFKNTTPTDAAERTREADQAVASYSETFEASGDPAIVLTHADNI